MTIGKRHPTLAFISKLFGAIISIETASTNHYGSQDFSAGGLDPYFSDPFSK